MTQVFLIISLIPIIHFAIVYFLAKKTHILNKLKRNYAIMYLDWLFVFVNISLFMNESATMTTFILFLLLCIIPITHLKKGWRNSKQKRKETTLFFNTNGSLNGVGVAHGAFMLMQGTFALQFFFSHAKNNFYFVGLIALLCYFVAYCLIIKYVRNLRFVGKVEMPFVIFGLVLVILRLIWAMYELSII